MARMRALRVRRKPHTVFGTIKAQSLSNQAELVLVFIIMRWSRSDERFNEVGLKRPIAEPNVAE